MPATANANMMALTHAGSSGINTIFPDVCKTPTPAGPIPIPYPNIAQSSDTADGSSTVKVDGKPIMLKSANYKMSAGDEAGSAQGVVSSKIKGKAEPVNYSFDVKADGANVLRLTDMLLQNVGTANTPPGTNLEPPVIGKMLQTEECKRTHAKQAQDEKGKEAAWDKSGVISQHRSHITSAAKLFHVVVYIRQTKAVCGKWIKSNHQPKPHACMTGTTIKDEPKVLEQVQAFLDSKHPSRQWEKMSPEERRRKGWSETETPMDMDYLYPTEGNDGWSYDAGDYVGVVGESDDAGWIVPRRGGGTQTISYNHKWTTGDYDLQQVLYLGAGCMELHGDKFAEFKKYVNESCNWDAIQHGPQSQWVTNDHDAAAGAPRTNMPKEMKEVLSDRSLAKRAVQTLPPPRDPMKVLDTEVTIVSGNGVASTPEQEDVWDALVCQGCGD